MGGCPGSPLQMKQHALGAGRAQTDQLSIPMALHLSNWRRSTDWDLVFDL